MIRRQTCPICEKELPIDALAELSTFPFCSDRCKQIDLYRWSEGRYAIVEPIDPNVAEFMREMGDDVETELP